jgi:hypothetical protein
LVLPRVRQNGTLLGMNNLIPYGSRAVERRAAQALDRVHAQSSIQLAGDRAQAQRQAQRISDRRVLVTHALAAAGDISDRAALEVERAPAFMKAEIASLAINGVRGLQRDIDLGDLFK